MFKNNSAAFNKILGWGVAATIILAIIGGLMMVGSPMKARDQKLDNKRLNNMQATARVISCYAVTHDAGLPETVEEIKAAIDGGVKYESKQRQCRNLNWKKDPLTDIDFEYRRLSSNSFELCGVFARKQDPRLAQNNSIYGTNNRDVLNTTGPRASEGRHCYAASGWSE